MKNALLGDFLTFAAGIWVRATARKPLLKVALKTSSNNEKSSRGKSQNTSENGEEIKYVE